MKHKKKKRIIYSCAVICLLTTAGYTYYSSQRPANDTQSHQLQVVTFKELLAANQENQEYLTGKIVPNQISKINADSSKGTIHQVHVKVGDTVKKGQKLFTYYHPEGQLALKEAETTVAKTQNKINELTQTVATKTEQLSKKQNELTEVSNQLAKAKEAEQEALKQTKQNLEEAIQGLTETIQSANSELADAQLDLASAQQQQEVLTAKAQAEEVVASVDGLVQKIDESQINTSGSGENGSFMEIMDTSSLKVQGTVDEFKKAGLTVNQPVKIIDRKNQKQHWQGKLTKIENIANEEKEESTISKYPFEVVLDEQENLPTIGSHVYLQPQTEASTEQALPNSYLFKEKEKSFVWKVQAGKIVKQEVGVGQTDQAAGKTIITSGLQKEDRLVLPDPTISNGMELTAQ